MTNATHTRVERLLPWYVNGTLDAEDLRLVERHLDSCRTCESDVELLRHVAGAVTAATPVPLVPESSAADFIDRLPADGMPMRSRRRSAWLLAAAAALAAILLSARIENVPAPDYRTAADVSTLAPQSFVLEIYLEDTVDSSERVRLFEAIGAHTLTTEPDIGRFEVVVSVRAGDGDDLASYTAQLEGLTGIRSARVIALHLPVRSEQP